MLYSSSSHRPSSSLLLTPSTPTGLITPIGHMPPQQLQLISPTTTTIQDSNQLNLQQQFGYYFGQFDQRNGQQQQPTKQQQMVTSPNGQQQQQPNFKYFLGQHY
ncbi:hypothetical protein DERP_009810 [Dermatophagoides pteronyssinus]|uniref:Uncharacterized protein n=1 Tax=Dermatophagoides pteronyssinus TaxID=6956 RepID=A0ABQ8IRD5_DERPT|nr:hypothetical protein DERP_009810 [Dermatophagoides pteronyssinus]